MQNREEKTADKQLHLHVRKGILVASLFFPARHLYCGRVSAIDELAKGEATSWGTQAEAVNLQWNQTY